MIETVKPPLGFSTFPGVQTAGDVFLGYLMLDAWIANLDRHHENWGLVLTKDKATYLAPSYDHASSLGRIETDEEKNDRLTTKDRNRTVQRYVERAPSAFYASQSSAKPLSTLDAFKSASRFLPHTAFTWLKRLEDIPMSEVERMLRQIPSDRISDVSIKFALEILTLNRTRLLNCVGSLLQ